MRAPRIILQILALAVVLHTSARASTANHGAFQVIVNPDNEISAIDRDLLRDAYLKKVVEWDDGEGILPIDLPDGYPARNTFTARILRKTPAQLRTYWSQQIFSGKGVPPPEADSPEDVISYVLANKGAIGYLPADVDPGKAKVVAIK
jgi:ABC-type phosphate transport system substrate-binding protein